MAGGGGQGLGGALPWRWQRGPSYAQSLCSLAPVQGDMGGLPAHPLCVAGAGVAAWGGEGGAGTQQGWGKSQQQAACYGGLGEDLEGEILHSSCPLCKWGEKVFLHAFKVGLMGKLQGRDGKGGRIWGGGTKHPHPCTLLPEIPWPSTEGPRPTSPSLSFLHYNTVGQPGPPTPLRLSSFPVPTVIPMPGRAPGEMHCPQVLPHGASRWEGPSSMRRSDSVSLPAPGAVQEPLLPHP